MKNAFKMSVTHFFVICVAILFFTTISNLVAGNKTLSIQFPFQIMITGVLTALPSMLFYFKNEPTKRQYILRFVIHFFIIEAVVMCLGFAFNWYDNIIEALCIAFVVVLVYAVVLIYTKFSDMTTAKDINDALNKFHNGNDSEQ